MSAKKGKSKMLIAHSKIDAKSIFEQIYLQYFDKLYLYARVICGVDGMAKDVVSDLFFNLLENETDFDKIDNLESYLYVSVRNLSIKALNLSRKKVASDNNDDVVIKSIDYINPEELLLEKELRSALDQIVSSLPEQCQLVFRMAKEREMKYAEIAAELDVSVETVKSQLKIAQRKLRTEVVNFYLDNEKGKKQEDIRNLNYNLLLVGLYYCEIANF